MFQKYGPNKIEGNEELNAGWFKSDGKSFTDGKYKLNKHQSCNKHDPQINQCRDNDILSWDSPFLREDVQTSTLILPRATVQNAVYSKRKQIRSRSPIFTLEIQT